MKDSLSYGLRGEKIGSVKWTLPLIQSYLKILDINAIGADQETEAYGPTVQRRLFTKVAPSYDLSVQMLIYRWPALRWADSSDNTLNGAHPAHKNEMIAQAIYEYTGQILCRKQVSSHNVVLWRISVPIFRAAAKLSEAVRQDTATINHKLGRAAFLLARRNHATELAPTQRRRRQGRRNAQTAPEPQARLDEILPDGPTYSLFHTISRFAPQNDRELSIQALRPLDINFLSLSSVNRFFQTEILEYIESHLSFDFTWNAAALETFFKHITPAHRRQVQHIAIELVDGHAPNLPSPSTTFGAYLSDNLPNLRRVSLDFIPCDPVQNPNVTRNYSVPDPGWSLETERFLSSLGELKATVTLSLQPHHCDRFEKEYVGVRGWRYVRSGEVSEPEYKLV